jgi:hypothetical protein
MNKKWWKHTPKFKKIVEIWWHCFSKNGKLFSHKNEESRTKYTYFTIFLFFSFFVAKFQNSPTHPPKRKGKKKKLLHYFSSQNLSFFNNKKDWGFLFLFFSSANSTKIAKIFLEKILRVKKKTPERCLLLRKSVKISYASVN